MSGIEPNSFDGSGIEPNNYDGAEAEADAKDNQIYPDAIYKETYQKAYQQALKPWYKKRSFIISASLAALIVVGALSPKTSEKSTISQKTETVKQTAANTAPPKVSGIVLTQNGSSLAVGFTDVWTHSASDTYSINYQGARSGVIAQKGNATGIYARTISNLKSGTLNITFVASNSIGSSAPTLASVKLVSPSAISNLQLIQNGVTSVTASWDPGAGGGGSDMYEIAWNGSAHGTATPSESSFDIPISSLGNLQVSVRAVTSGFPASSWVRKSLKLEQPWNPAPDGSSDLEWKYPASSNCSEDYGMQCGTVMVRAITACTGGIYAEVNNLDSSGMVVGFSNDTVSALQAGQIALMQFHFTEPGSKYQLTKLVCEG